MKRIRTLLSPTPGLHEYRTQSDAPLDWETFRRGGSSLFESSVTLYQHCNMVSAAIVKSTWYQVIYRLSISYRKAIRNKATL